MAYNSGDILLNRYRIERLLGRGGFAEVYLATHLKTKGMRALKVLRKEFPGLGSRDLQAFDERFELEAQLGELFDHPNLVRVYDFERDQDALILVMEYCPGKSLADRIKESKGKAQNLDLNQALQLGIDTANGLAALHKKDIVHRDLKPSNILFDSQGRAKVSDLGLAQTPDGLSQRSQLGSLAGKHPGTPGYMSPEQEKTTDYLKPPSDVYALGVVLFETLTGRMFQSQKPGTRLCDLRSDVPDWLDDLVMRMLSEAYIERPWGGREVLQLLEKGIKEEQLKEEEKRRRRELEEQQRKEAEEKARREAEEKRRREFAEQQRKAAEEKARREAEEKRRKEEEEERRRKEAERRKKELQEQERQKAYEKAKRKAKFIQFFVTGILLIVVSWGFTMILDHLIAQPVQNTKQTSQQNASEMDIARDLPPAQAAQSDRWTSGVDGMELVYIPAGEFQMGSNDGENDEKPVLEVYLDGYWMDRTEVTNAMYAKCVAAGICDEPRYTSSVTRKSYYHSRLYANYPVIYVSSYDAQNYCAWAGRRLPTEAEWEKGARSLDGRAYPWGNDKPTCDKANIGQCVGDTNEVGSYPAGASPYGLMDMAGNVLEWVADWYTSEYNVNLPSSNLTGDSTGQFRVLRGGSFNDSVDLRAANRIYLTPGNHSGNVGFRCAVFPEKSVSSTGPAPMDDLNEILPVTATKPTSTKVAAPVLTPPSVTLSASQQTPSSNPGYPQVSGDPRDTQVSTQDGMELVYIPAGEFIMGSKFSYNEKSEKPSHLVNLDAYWIDRTEVTNAMYSLCVTAGFCDVTGDYSRTRDTYSGNPEYSNYPAISVNWFQAQAYCSWAGRRLPTEAEWEKAARGTDGRIYPWGDESPTCNLANFYDCIGDTNMVGSYPNGASPYGLLDMAGNVREWVADWYSENYYESSPIFNPTGPSSGREKVLRGGSFESSRSDLRTADRYPSFDDVLEYPFWQGFGFRCAVSSVD